MTNQELKIKPSSKICSNCQAEVAGLSYCPQCGQKSDTHILAFREFLAEIADGLFNMDSRLWRTLTPLITRPGKLTNEFTHSRRMHYLPPFRLYLILSLLFFLVPYDRSFFSEESFNDELNPEVAATLQENLGTEIAAEIEAELNNQQETGITAEENCQLDGLLSNGSLKALVLNACLKLENDPQAFLDGMADTFPVLLIISIPLVALLMQLLYVFSSRRYIEHVVFLLHAHSFFFLISITMAFISLLGLYYPMLTKSMNIVRVITAWYVPISMLLAMKRVYGGSKLAIFSKAIAVVIGYLLCFLLVLFFGALFTAISI